MPAYREQFPTGTLVRVASRETLERFMREWRWHHPLESERLQFADSEAWMRWEDVVEVREIKRKVLILLSRDGRRVLVDAILGYAIARHEILRRAPHAIVSGTLARDEA